MAFNIQEFLFGRNPEMQQATTQTPGQQGVQNQITQGVGAPMGAGMEYLMAMLSGDPEAMKAFEDPYKMQFENEVVPGISERFAGMGTGGAQDSSAFQQTLGRAGTEFSTQLAAMREGLKSNAMQQLMGLTGMGQQQSFQNVYDPGSPGVVADAVKGFGQGAGKAASNYALS